MPASHHLWSRTAAESPERLVSLVIAAVALPSQDGTATIMRVPEVGDRGDQLPDVLDDVERGRLARFRLPVDRVRYRFAHTALRLILGERLGRPPESLRFDCAPCQRCGGSHGRPILATGEPIEFSLSHGGGLVAVGVARSAIGVDVEPVSHAARARRVGEFLHPGERELLAESSDENVGEVFTRVWARKEAYLKGLGAGLSRGLETDDVRTSPPGWVITDRRVGNHLAAIAVRA